jgi:beta-galactosidase
MAKVISDYNALGGNRGVAVSEYGAGASIRQHESGMTRPPKPSGPWHPEEWQAIVHEKNYRAIAGAGCCWGGFVWNMFDFASAGRREGDTNGRNDKGLVTYDRKTRKDAFYFYKANWSGEPVLYITSRRFTERAAPQTEVKVYANIAKNSDVTLVINGRLIGAAKPDAFHICRWENATLTPGPNEVVVTARWDSRGQPLPLRDTCTWTLAPASPSTPALTPSFTPTSAPTPAN